uniref:Uncharacterized protein n=1 Tax=Candidatus Kentrum sp. UNK TaxID=2126344 RepID=A0A451B2J6_9GAMM|nr:MAG: hypothetical protein BECKUNK1418G_GA0071005_11276 [Candidatus Kentron sp. UNK]VFK72511.1 MAG: hypothetical protein BECKUNK1418H_GA0071006_11196 [Candidatus Kentron sp. UNK]
MICEQVYYLIATHGILEFINQIEQWQQGLTMKQQPRFWAVGWMRVAIHPTRARFICWGDETLNMIVKRNVTRGLLYEDHRSRKNLFLARFGCAKLRRTLHLSRETAYSDFCRRLA